MNTATTFLHRGDAGFESAVLGTLFNQRDPERRPEVYTQPKTVDDIIAILKFAARHGKKVSVCSGGHSWSANHLRPDTVLIDMANFNRYSVDKDRMTAQAEPGVGGSVLLAALYRQGLFFPAGHCKGVCIGGYLLQGGFAWNGRKLGMACESVIGLDIVTAEGRLVHASASENADLYWAARGAGGGFFGIVVRFYLKLYPLPPYRAMMMHVFKMKQLEEVFQWAYENGPEVPRSIELQILMSRKTLMYLSPGMEVFAPIFADTREEFEAAKAFMDRSPIRKKAYVRIPAFDPGINNLYRMAMSHYPEKHHWGVDNMWTHAPLESLMPHLQHIADTLPPAPTHLLWLNWYPPATRQSMAFSVEDNIYIALYGAWKKATDTARYGNWALDCLRRMEHLGSGIQLADEGLHRRTARFIGDPQLQQLDRIRLDRDPQHLFHEWHSRPDQSHSSRPT